MPFYKIKPSEIKKPIRAVNRVFIHCSASDNPTHDNAETMEKWHKERGFKEIGYHLFIRKDGTVQTGRSLEKTPAAQEGHNTGTIAICCHGLKKDLFTKAQRAALVDVCHHLNDLYDQEITFHGHKEVAAKECPVFDYKDWLNLDDEGRLCQNSP